MLNRARESMCAAGVAAVVWALQCCSSNASCVAAGYIGEGRGLANHQSDDVDAAADAVVRTMLLGVWDRKVLERRVRGQTRVLHW